MSFIVNDKLNRFVIANPNKCMACYTCMSACYESAKKRGKVAKPRLLVVHTESGSMPNQCRHCEDAPCANVCPTGAIKFGADKIELHEELCIGCKMCVMVCPFGCVLPESEPMPSVNYMFEEPVDKLISVSVGGKNVAVKCDLCEGREEGPACVGACPNKALTYVTPDNMENSNVDVKSRNAILKLVSFMKDSVSSKTPRDKGVGV
jgi:Fe-S-cluster-containing hydrogenase component 2